MPGDIRAEFQAELHPAFMFVCECCDRDNFVHAMVRHLEGEELREAAIQEGKIEAWESLPEGATGNLVTGPELARCGQCLAMHQVVLRNLEEL